LLGLGSQIGIEADEELPGQDARAIGGSKLAARKGEAERPLVMARRQGRDESFEEVVP
jgi:hypothetical protein